MKKKKERISFSFDYRLSMGSSQISNE